MMRYYLFFFSLLIISIAAAGVKSQNAANNAESVSFRSPFRYVIAYNKIDRKISSKDEDRRFIEVVMDKKSFSKTNLITLFNLISERFPKPKLMYIDVYTDLEDVSTPEEGDQPKMSERDEIHIQYGDMASFTGDGKDKFFYTYFQNGDFEEVKIEKKVIPTKRKMKRPK